VGIFRTETWTAQSRRADKMRRMKQKQAVSRYKRARRERRKKWIGI
jgi:hypothetical protein